MNIIKNFKFKLTVAGLISGLISGFLGEFLIYPGIIFGIFMVITFLVSKEQTSPFGMKFFFLLGSPVAYFFAVKITFISPTPEYFSYFLAGAIGAFFMVTSFYVSLSKFEIKNLHLLVLLGGVLALSDFFRSFYLNEDVVPVSPFLFVIWQTGMAFALGWVTDSNFKKFDLATKQSLC
jgi:hypothetical protein